MFHNKPLAQILEQFQADPGRGLTSAEAAGRREKYGPNKLKEGKKKSLLQLFAAQ